IRRVRALVDDELGELVGDVHVRAFERLADDCAAAACIGLADDRYRRTDPGTIIVTANRNQSVGIANRYQRESGYFLLRSIRILRQNSAPLVDRNIRQLRRRKAILKNRGRGRRLRELADPAHAYRRSAGRNALPWR